jgi:predicted nucleic acid-binding protein
VDVVYDAGALAAGERRDKTVWALHKRLAIDGLAPLVPSVVLAQVWRGGPQAELSRLLAACEIEPVDEGVARSAGAACGKARTSDVVDAIVVVRALQLDALVVTSDPGDLERIADALGTRLRLVAV